MFTFLNSFHRRIVPLMQPYHLSLEISQVFHVETLMFQILIGLWLLPEFNHLLIPPFVTL